MSEIINIEDYTTKSFVVRGETREYKDTLKALGGKWNSRLTDKETGDKFGAWLFWSDKRKEIDNWLLNGCKIVENNQENKETGFSTTSSSKEIKNEYIKKLEKKVDHLTRLVEALCKAQDIKEQKSDDDFLLLEEDHEEPINTSPPKRLLKKDK